MELDFSKIKREIFELLGDKKIIVLATSSDNRVTARNMIIILWKYEDGRTFRDFLDISERKAYREIYNINA